MDLGFSYALYKNGHVAISRNEKIVILLKNNTAAKFQREITDLGFANQQQLMARVSGNYKRGNERKTKNHPKNKL